MTPQERLGCGGRRLYESITSSNEISKRPLPGVNIVALLEEKRLLEDRISLIETIVRAATGNDGRRRRGDMGNGRWRQAVIAALEDAGKPLGYVEIFSRIDPAMLQGIRLDSAKAMISITVSRDEKLPNPRLFRISSGYFGLRGRDEQKG